MNTSIQVYSDCGPWGDWEPVIRAEMARVGIPDHKRETLTVVCCPLSMRRKSQIRYAEAQSVSGQK